MSKKLLSRLVLLVITAGLLTGCSSVRSLIQRNATGSPAADTTTATYTAVQEIRDAQTNQEAVQVTTDEVDTALQAVDTMDATEALNSQDVGL